MLPFLKPKNIASVVMTARKKDGTRSPAPEMAEGEMHLDLMAASESLISAVHSKDAGAVAKAIQSAYNHLESIEDSQEGDLDEKQG